MTHGPTTSNYAGAAGSNDIYNRRTFEHQKDDLMKRGKTFARKMSAPVLRLFHCNRKKAAETLLWIKATKRPTRFFAFVSYLIFCYFATWLLCHFVILWLCHFVILWLCYFVILWLCSYIRLNDPESQLTTATHRISNNKPQWNKMARARYPLNDNGPGFQIVEPLIVNLHQSNANTRTETNTNTSLENLPIK